MWMYIGLAVVALLLWVCMTEAIKGAIANLVRDEFLGHADRMIHLAQSNAEWYRRHAEELQRQNDKLLETHRRV